MSANLFKNLGIPYLLNVPVPGHSSGQPQEPMINPFGGGSSNLGTGAGRSSGLGAGRGSSLSAGPVYKYSSSIPSSSANVGNFITNYSQFFPDNYNDASAVISFLPKDKFSELIVDYIISNNTDNTDVLNFLMNYYKHAYSILKDQIKTSNEMVIKNIEKNNLAIAKKQKVILEQLNKLK